MDLRPLINLFPSVHISDIVSRAHKRALLAIYRFFVSRNVNVLLRAYKVYVRHE